MTIRLFRHLSTLPGIDSVYDIFLLWLQQSLNKRPAFAAEQKKSLFLNHDFIK